MQQHLRYSRRHHDGCFAHLTWRYAPLTEACAVEVPDDLCGYARLPAVLATSTYSTPLDESVLTLEDAQSQLRAAWVAEGLPDFLDEVVQSEVCNRIEAIVLAWQPETCVDPDEVVFEVAAYIPEDDNKLWAFCLWTRSKLVFSKFSHLPPRTFQRLRCALQDLVDDTAIGRLLAWQHRMETAYVPVEHDVLNGQDRRVHELEVFFGSFAFQDVCFEPFLRPISFMPDCSRVPVTYEDGVPTLWILHLFSGRRRCGDCHFWIQCFPNLIPGYRLRLLSVDTAIHPKLGNLDRGPVFTRLIRMIRHRHFAAGLTGPPCETFSAACHLQLPGGNHPRPLRSFTSPWMLPERTGRELYQTMIGSRLFLHSIILEVELTMC